MYKGVPQCLLTLYASKLNTCLEVDGLVGELRPHTLCGSFLINSLQIQIYVLQNALYLVLNLPVVKSVKNDVPPQSTHTH